MKKLIYKYENMKQAASLLEQVQVTGIQNFRLLAAIADLLDSGELSEETEAGTLTYHHGNPPAPRRKLKPPSEGKEAEGNKKASIDDVGTVEGANNDT